MRPFPRHPTLRERFPLTASDRRDLAAVLLMFAGLGAFLAVW